MGATMVGGGIGYLAYRGIKTHFDCIMIKAKTAAEIEKIKARRKSLERTSQVDLREDLNEDVNSTNEAEVRNWLENFEVKFPHSFIKMPPVIDAYVSRCPSGFEVPVITALTAELACCFSNVRAKYLDNKYHRPNIMTVIEAPFSSLKGKIKEVVDSLFGRRIQRDLYKISDTVLEHKIIQTIAPNITEAALLDILGNNQGIHAIIMDPETTTMVNAMKKGGGITYDTLRKAYDNDEVTRMNRTKNAPQGNFTTAINLVLTGTPNATSAFLDSEIEGGTASRMCLCVLPKIGKDVPTFVMPEGVELVQLQNQLDEWTEVYAYSTDNDGNDSAVDPHITDLQYVNDVLKRWTDDQYDLAQHENNKARESLRLRIASSAFNCAIVWHMLYGEPTSRQRCDRENVINLTIYMANYFMERWLHKFGAKHNAQQSKFTSEELVKVQRAPSADVKESAGHNLPDDGFEKGKLFLTLKEEGRSIAELSREYGLTKDQINGYIRRYKEKLGDSQ